MVIEIPVTGTEQEPKPQEPKSATQEPQQPAQGQEPKAAPSTASATATVDPAEANFATSIAPPDFADKWIRLVKTVADSLRVTRYDDRRRIVRLGIESEAEAMLAAADSMQRRLVREPDAANRVREYLATGQGADGFTALTDVAKSPETQTLEFRAMAGRAESPILAMLNDYVVDPVGSIFPATAHVFYDTFAGLANFAGADVPAMDMKSTIRSLGGLRGDPEETQRQQAAIAATADEFATAMGFAGKTTGTVIGFIPGGPLKGAATGANALKAAATAPRTILEAGAAVGGKIGGKVGGEVGAFIGKGAGGFGLFEAVAARGEGGEAPTALERLENFGHGAAAGAILSGGAILGKAFVEGLLRNSYKSLASTEKQAVDMLKAWAESEGVVMRAGQTQGGFVKELSSRWVEAGMPGLPKTDIRQLIYYGVQGGMAAAGFSALDAEFRGNVYEGLFHGDAEKMKAAMAQFAGNALALAALHMPLRDIPGFQRRSRGAERPADGQRGPEPEPRPSGGSRPSSAAEPPPRPPGSEAPPRQEPPRQAPPEPPPSSGARRTETPTGYTYEVPGTKVKFDVSADGRATLSKEMRDFFGTGLVEVPVEPLIQMLSRMRIHDALQAKTASGDDVSADGIKATATDGKAPGVMRRYLMGQPQESPLGPEPDWKPVDSLPTRPKDHLELDQAELVQGLTDVLNQRQDLTPADLSMLSHARTVLDTVAARNDQSVAESLPAIRDLLQTVASGEPAAAGAAIKAIGEMLTTKLPQDAIADMQAKARPTRVKVKSDAGRVWKVLPKGSDPRDLEGLPRRVIESMGRAADREFTEEARSSARLEAYNREVEWLNLSENYQPVAPDLEAAEHWASLPDPHQGWRPKEGDIVRSDSNAYVLTSDSDGNTAKMTRLSDDGVKYSLPEGLYVTQTRPLSGLKPTGLRAERIHPPRSAGGAEQAASSSPEAGFMMADAAHRAVEMLGIGMRGGIAVARKPWDFFQRSQIQRVADLGMPDIAKIGWEGTTNTKGYRADLDGSGLLRMRRLPRKQLDSMNELIPDDIGGYSTTYGNVMDAGLAGHFGSPRALSAKEQDVVDLARAVYVKAGEIALDLGVASFKQAGAQRLTRIPSPEWQAASVQRSGPLYEAVMNWLQAKFDWSRTEADRKYTESRSLTRLDATETRRVIEVLPLFVDVPGRMSPVRLFESRPLEHTERMAHSNAQIMGVRSVLPREVPKREPGADSYQTEPGLEPLPLPAQQLVDSLSGRGLEAQRAVASMLYTMHGMPAHRDPSLFTPGEPGYHVARVVGSLFGVVRSAALSLSFPMNVAEPLSNVPFFGSAAVSRGYRDVVRSFFTGGIADVHQQMVEEGWIADSKLNNPWTGDSFLEDFENTLRNVGDVLVSPLRLSQDANELVNVMAARERLAAMQRGEGSDADGAALRLLGFSDAEAGLMLRGEGTPEMYDRYRKNIVGSLVGGKSQVPAEKSDAAASRWFNSLVWFTNFFQTRSRILDTLLRRIREAPDLASGSEAFMRLLKFGGMTLVAGATGKLFKEWLLGGKEGMADYIRESTSGGTTGERVANTAESMLGLFASGVFGGAGQPLVPVVEAVTEPGSATKKVGEAVRRLIAPLDRGIQFSHFLLAANGDDVPGYENMSFLEKVGKYTRDVLPAARAVHEGLFGISALAITGKDPALDGALDSYYRWRRQHKPLPEGSDEPDTRAWRDAMRLVVEHTMAGKTWTDQQVVDAVVSAEAAKMTLAEAPTAEGKPGLRGADAYSAARNAVVASLRQRQILPDPKSKELSPAEAASLYSHLGERNIQILRDFDTALETLARRVKGGSRREKVDELLSEKR